MRNRIPADSRISPLLCLEWEASIFLSKRCWGFGGFPLRQSDAAWNWPLCEMKGVCINKLNTQHIEQLHFKYKFFVLKHIQMSQMILLLARWTLFRQSWSLSAWASRRTGVPRNTNSTVTFLVEFLSAVYSISSKSDEKSFEIKHGNWDVCVTTTY